MKKLTILVSLLIIMIVISSCASTEEQASATLTPTPSITPLPSATLTPEPTQIPIPPFEELALYFEYDRSIDLEISWGLTAEGYAVTVDRLNFVGADDCSILSFLVRPEGEGPFPAVIFMHMGQDNKDQYLEEAVTLGENGVVSILFNSPFLRGCGGETNRIGYIRTVIDIRRSVDLLESFDFVDPERIGYVGHSFGATWGGVVAGVEPRIKAFVLIGGTGQISGLDSTVAPDLNAINYIGHSQAAFLLQFSTNDGYISLEDANQYFEAAPEPKTILWYDTTHRGLQDDGQVDRLEWLAEHLGFEVP